MGSEYNRIPADIYVKTKMWRSSAAEHTRRVLGQSSFPHASPSNIIMMVLDMHPDQPIMGEKQSMEDIASGLLNEERQMGVMDYIRHIAISYRDGTIEIRWRVIEKEGIHDLKKVYDNRDNQVDAGRQSLAFDPLEADRGKLRDFVSYLVELAFRTAKKERDLRNSSEANWTRSEMKLMAKGEGAGLRDMRKTPVEEEVSTDQMVEEILDMFVKTAEAGVHPMNILMNHGSIGLGQAGVRYLRPVKRQVKAQSESVNAQQDVEEHSTQSTASNG